MAVFGIDPRSLAIFRMGAGGLLLVDLLVRLRDFNVMYGESGLMPIPAVRQIYGSGWRWSIYWLNGTLSFHLVMFIVAALLAAALLVGFLTRWATIGSWFLLASLHARAPLVINGADVLLLLLLFWGSFLPLGRVWSVDAGRRPMLVADALRPVFSVGSFAIILQLCLMYWFTALIKFDHDWTAGQGVQNALMWGGYNRQFGDWLLGYPTLMWLLSLATVWLELIGPCLLFIPWRTSTFRMLTIIAFVSFHLGIELALYIGGFSHVSILAWTLLLPAQFWAWPLWGRIRRRFRGGVSMAVPSRSQPAPPAFSGVLKKRSIAAELFCGACLIFVVVFNAWGFAESYDKSRHAAIKIPSLLRNIANVTALEQEWGMFATPQRFSVWYAGRARLQDGREIDLLRGGNAMVYDPPARLASVHSNHRWRKYCNLLAAYDSLRHFRNVYAKYLFNSWNASHDESEQIQVLDLLCFYQTVADGEDGDEFKMDVFSVVESDDVSVEDTIHWDAPWMGTGQIQNSNDRVPMTGAD